MIAVNCPARKELVSFRLLIAGLCCVVAEAGQPLAGFSKGQESNGERAAFTSVGDPFRTAELQLGWCVKGLASGVGRALSSGPNHQRYIN